MQRRDRGNRKYESAKATIPKTNPPCTFGIITQNGSVREGLMGQRESCIMKGILNPAEKAGPHHVGHGK